MTSLPESVIKGIDIWLIKITLLDKKGYTLWLEDDGENSRVLGIGENVLLFRSLTNLYDFILNKTVCNLSEFPAYKVLQRRISSLKKKKVPDTVQVNLNRVGDLLSKGNPASWKLQTHLNTLDCLNMLWDLVITLNDTPSIQLMTGHDDEAKASELHRFMDALTFTPTTDAKFGAFDMTSIYKSFEEIVTRVRNRILVVC